MSSSTPESGTGTVALADLDKWEEKLASGWRPRVASVRKLIALAREALALRAERERVDSILYGKGDRNRGVSPMTPDERLARIHKDWGPVLQAMADGPPPCPRCAPGTIGSVLCAMYDPGRCPCGCHVGVQP